MATRLSWGGGLEGILDEGILDEGVLDRPAPPPHLRGGWGPLKAATRVRLLEPQVTSARSVLRRAIRGSFQTRLLQATIFLGQILG